MELLASVSCFTNRFPRLLGLAHVLSAINDYLDVSGQFSLPDAAATGKVFLFQRVLKRVDLTDNLNQILRYHWISQALQKAIEGGHLAMVKYIHEVHPAPLAVSSLRVALRYGQLEIVEWLSDHRADQLCVDSPPTVRGVSRVSCCLLQHCPRPWQLTANMGALRWLYERGCIRNLSLVGDIAAKKSDLAMVEWAHLQGRYTFTQEAITGAVKRGRLDILQFLHQHKYTESAPTNLLAEVEGRGHTEVALYLKQKRICNELYPASVIRIASELGHLNVLEKFLTARSKQDICELARDIPKTAAEHGHLAVLEWAHEHQLGEWTWSIVHYAALGGHLRILQWLHIRLPHLFEDSAAIRNASSHGHLDVVKWLHENTQPFKTTETMDGAARGGFLKIVKWLHANRTDGCTVDAMTSAVKNGHVEVVAWLHENRTEGCEPGVMQTALRNGDLGML